ncbi:fatty acid desaturase [Janthinobacterium psychrotolerans]|uniref:Fatty acid desaturase n=1 Tax=Janthinobacterium psychrotolerans TaxID=1747903 RepID=A0A1A7C843_9BURK|nr:fatty acid desaturase [Janthinobacterium psychrotolerans]OBV40940.1 Fatty acid desaturase [Janthinobacterium psychrotolerans]
MTNSMATKAAPHVDWYRSPLKKEQLAWFSRRSDMQGALHVAAHLLLLCITASLAYGAFLGQHYGWALLALFFHGTFYSFLGWAGAGHELMHRTVFRTRRYNDIFLALFAFLTWNNHIYFRASHIRHHQKTVLSDQDGEVRLPQTLRYREWLWALTLDLPALYRALRIVVENSLGSIRGQWGARLFPDASGKRQVIRVARMILLGHLVLATGFVATGHWPLLLLVTLAPFIADWLNKTLALAQHFGMQPDVDDFRLNSRTVLLHPFLAFLYWQMNYHIEHHMYPAVPFYQLKALRTQLQDDLPPAAHGMRALLQEIAAIKRRQEQAARAVKQA